MIHMRVLPIFVKVASLALYESPSYSEVTLEDMDNPTDTKPQHNTTQHNTAQHNKLQTMCLIIGMHCIGALVRSIAFGVVIMAKLNYYI